MKTSELVGTALDWVVAKCEEPVGGYKAWVQADLDKGILHGCHYSTDWEWCGPIIERRSPTSFRVKNEYGDTWRMKMSQLLHAEEAKR